MTNTVIDEKHTVTVFLVGDLNITERLLERLHVYYWQNRVPIRKDCLVAFHRFVRAPCHPNRGPVSNPLRTDGPCSPQEVSYTLAGRTQQSPALESSFRTIQLRCLRWPILGEHEVDGGDLLRRVVAAVDMVEPDFFEGNGLI